MGSLKEHFVAKNEARKAAGLSEWLEDTADICKKIRASSPPIFAADFADLKRNRQVTPLPSAVPLVCMQ